MGDIGQRESQQRSDQDQPNAPQAQMRMPFDEAAANKDSECADERQHEPENQRNVDGDLHDQPERVNPPLGRTRVDEAHEEPALFPCLANVFAFSGEQQGRPA